MYSLFRNIWHMELKLLFFLVFISHTMYKIYTISHFAAGLKDTLNGLEEKKASLRPLYNKCIFHFSRDSFCMRLQ